MKIQNIALASVVLLTLATAAGATTSATEGSDRANIVCPTGQNCMDVGQSGSDQRFFSSHRHNHRWFNRY